MADWEGLHHDLLILIVKKINLIEDFMTFGMVCKSWHAVAATNKPYLRGPQTPWLMFPSTSTSTSREAEADRQIFSLLKQDMLTKNLYIPQMSNKKCIGLNYGWVLTISRNGEDINLLHPLSPAQIQLPPLENNSLYNFKPDRPPYLFLNKAALSSNPSESPSDFILMIVYGRMHSLRYWRPGDKMWGYVGAGYSDLIYHRDQFYAITCTGKVVDLVSYQGLISPRPRTNQRLLLTCQYPYIVAGSTPGSVFVLAPFRAEIEFNKESPGTIGYDDDDENFWSVKQAMRFEVYELDLINDRWSEIKSLGDRAMFVGLNTSIALENAYEYSGVKPNHVYFTNHTTSRWENDMGCYSLEDGQTTHFRVEESLVRVNSPFWFIPSL